MGSERLSLLFTDTDLTSLGDSLDLRWGITRGGLDHIAFNDLRNVSIDYRLPVTPWDTALGVSYVRSDSLVIQNPFQDVNIRSDLETYAFLIRQPVYRTPSTELALWAGPAFRKNATFLMDEPFSFSR